MKVNRQSAIGDFLVACRDLLGEIEILNPGYLETCTKTSFSWAHDPGSVCLATNRKYFEQALGNSNIAAIVTCRGAITQKANSKALIILERCAELFYMLHNNNILRSETRMDVSDTVPSVAPTAQIATTAIVSPQSIIGDNARISEYCQLIGRVSIGSDCAIHPNVTIGTDGFFSKMIMGKKTHISHFGGVVIGNNCVIHVGTNIARSVNFNESTVLEDDVHIGARSNVGHDCRIGRNTDISANVQIMGRAEIGADVWLGANVVISNMVKVGNGAIVRIGSVVIEDVAEAEDVSGNFAIKHAMNLKNYRMRVR
jgi:UDP-3-O-[3-hydroxymyristoyl] glucosamine N-acyltransferase